MSDRVTGHWLDLYVLGGVGPNFSLAVQATRTAGCRQTVLVEPQGYAERRVTAQLSLASQLPDLFYGAATPSEATVTLENLAGDLSHFQVEEIRGHRITIRRQDRVLQEATTVFEGVISRASYGNTITLQCTSDDLTTYEQELPKHRVVSKDTRDVDVDAVLTAEDQDATFPMATDINLPIPIVLGEAPNVPLLFVYARDDFSVAPDGTGGYSSDLIVGDYDYMVCEKTADVPSITKQLNEAFQPGVVTQARITQVTPLTWQVVSDLLEPTVLDTNDADFQTGLYLYVTGLLQNAWEADRRSIGQFRRIEAYNPATGIITIDRVFDVTPTNGASIEIREYAILANTVYPGRTAIRFHIKQEHSGALTNLTGRVIRYQPVEKNLFRWTEQIDAGHWCLLRRGSDLVWDFDTGHITVTQVQSPIGDLSASRIGDTKWETDLDANAILQRIELPETRGNSYTISAWLRTNTPGVSQVTFAVIGKSPTWDWEVGFLEVEVSLTEAWTRYSQTFNWSPGPAYAQIGMGIVLGRFTPLEDATVDVWGLQLEAGDTMTAYEPVAGTNQALHHSVVDALEEVFHDTRTGLGLPIDPFAFEDARVATADLLLRCDGVIPSQDGTAVQAQEIISELCSYRGFWWQKRGSVIVLRTDTHLAPMVVPTFGTDETHYRNIFEVGALERPALTDTVKTLRLHYGLGVRPGTTETDFLYKLDYNVNSIGTKKEYFLQWVQDHNTADRIGQYLKARFSAGNYLTWAITVGQEGRQLQLGDVIPIIAPRYQPENLVRRSEQFLDTAVWSTTAALTANTTKPAPHGRSYSGAYTSGSTTLRQYIATTILDQLVYVRFHVAKVSGGAATVTVRLLDTLETQIVEETATCYGTAWQEMLFALDCGGQTDVAYLEIALPANTYIWGVSLTKEYQKPYIRTGATSVVPQTSWQITGIDVNGLGQYQLRLLASNPESLETYAPISWPSAPTEQDATDPRLLPPPAPTNLVLPPPVTLGYPSAVAGVNVGTDGVVNSWATIQFLMPVRNCVRCLVQRRVMGEQGWEPRWEDCATVTPGDTALGGPASVTAHHFVPGMLYEIRVVAFSSNGLTSTTEQDGTKTFTAYGDHVAPVPPVGLTVVQGTGRQIEIKASLAGVEPTRIPAEVAKLHCFRQQDSAIFQGDASYMEIDAKRGTVFHDNAVEYGRAYYYWVQTEDWSGNKSTIYPVGNGIGLPSGVLKLQGDIDIQAGTISADTLLVGRGSNLVPNAGFESGASGWTAVTGQGGWSIRTAIEAPVTSIRTPHYARRDYTSVIGTYESVTSPAAPGQIFVADGYACQWTPTLSGGGARLVIVFINASGNGIAWHISNVAAYTDPPAWTLLQVRSAVAPAGTVGVRLQVQCYQQTTGSIATFDDVRLVRSSVAAEITGTLKVEGGLLDGIQVVEGTGNELSFVGADKTVISGINVSTISGAKWLAIDPKVSQSHSVRFGDTSTFRWQSWRAYANAVILDALSGDIELVTRNQGADIRLETRNQYAEILLKTNKVRFEGAIVLYGAARVLQVYDENGTRYNIELTQV